jgi:hypothetical protein
MAFARRLAERQRSTHLFSPSFSLKASPKCRPRPSSALGARMAGTQARCSDHIPGTSGTRKSTHSCQEHLPVIHFVYGLNEKLRHLLSSYHFLSYPSLLAKATDATNAYKCYVASRKGFQGISSISRDVFHPKKSG